MEYVFNFFYNQIEYFVNETFMPKQKLMRLKKEEDCSDEINKLLDRIENEIKFEKEMELRQIRYENLVKDVENTEEDDNEKNNNNNGKISLLA